MANNEHYSPDPLPGLPKVTPEILQAYKDTYPNRDTEFEKLKHDAPILAHDITTGIQSADPQYLRLKAAFAEGVLYACGVLRLAAQTKGLEDQFAMEVAPTGDGGDGEDLQPLA